MSTNHHTPVPFGAGAASAVINGPLGQLDAAIASVIATGSGLSTTLTAQALAGQASLTVASSAGFLVGDNIYLGTGSTFESRIIATVPNGTTITVTANLSNTYAIGAPISKSPVELVDARAGSATLKARLDLLERGTSPREFGAKGDLVTDDTAAVQSALNTGVAFIDGTFLVSAALTYVEGTTILGYGTPSFDDGYMPSLIKGTVAGPLLKGAVATTRYNGVHLDGVAFVNLSTNAAALAVDLSQTSRARALECVFRGAQGAATGARLPAGVKLAGPAYYTVLHGCRFAWCVQAIALSSGGPFSGITGTPNASSIVQCSVAACDYGVFITDAVGVQVIGCVVDSFVNQAIRLAGSAQRCLIAGNYLEAVEPPAGASNIWVSAATAVNNLFVGNAHAGNGTPFVDTAGAKSMQFDHAGSLKIADRGMVMTEQTAPAAPAADQGHLFVRDNGAGKTQLCIIFNTGAIQVIATQP